MPEFRGLVNNFVVGDVRFDPDEDNPTYIGIHPVSGNATSTKDWTVFKFTYSGVDVTRIQRLTIAYDDRATAF